MNTPSELKYLFMKRVRNLHKLSKEEIIDIFLDNYRDMQQYYKSKEELRKVKEQERLDELKAKLKEYKGGYDCWRILRNSTKLK
jgi:hypothetical protein